MATFTKLKKGDIVQILYRGPESFPYKYYKEYAEVISVRLNLVKLSLINNPSVEIRLGEKSSLRLVSKA